jgi:hypothetical protein
MSYQESPVINQSPVDNQVITPKKLTQLALAKHLKVSQPMVARYAGMGMPVDNVQDARVWIEQYKGAAKARAAGNTNLPSRLIST